MSHKNQKKKCEICGFNFKTRDLYPIPLIRNSVQKTLLRRYQNIDEQGFLCFPDLRKVHAQFSEELLEQERGSLSDLEKEVIESIEKQDILTENVNEEFSETLTFGERLADRVAVIGGSWLFITIFGSILMSWVLLNTFFLVEDAFDPYPYILLNLALSTLAALQAPIIMMSQNRQAAKDRLQMEHDYMVNLKAELQIRQLNARLELFMRHHWQKMHEITRIQEELYQEVERRD